jgi:hypothetical protein
MSYTLSSSTFIVRAFHYLGVTVHTQLAWLTHTDQVRRKAPQRLCMWSPLLKSKSGLPSEMFRFISRSFVVHGLCIPYLEVCCLNPCREAVGGTIQASLHCYWCALVCRQANSWGFKGLILHGTHPGSNCFNPKLAGAQNPLVWQLERYQGQMKADQSCLRP